MNRENKLTEGAIGLALLRFAAPFLLASFLQALYGAVDLFVVGRFTGSAAVSAVAIGSQVMQTITGIILGISMGGTVLIARRVGEKNDDGAARAVGTVAVLFSLLAVILTPVMLLAVRPAIAVMETPAEAVAEAMRYLFICACGIPFIIGYNGVSGIFRGTGDSKTPVYFIGLACLINIVFDFLLTGALDMGAAGAAAATVLAQGISFLASLLYMKRRGLAFPVKREHVRLDGAAVRRILVVGLPLALQDALVNVSFPGHYRHYQYNGGHRIGSCRCGGTHHRFCYAAAGGICIRRRHSNGAEHGGRKAAKGLSWVVVRHWILFDSRRGHLPVCPTVAGNTDRHF